MSVSRMPLASRDINAPLDDTSASPFAFNTPAKQHELKSLRTEIESHRKLSQSALKRWQTEQRKLMEEQVEAISTLTSKNTTLQAENTSLKLNIEGLRFENKELRTKLNVLEAEASESEETWMDHIEKARTESETLQKRISKLKEAKERLEGELNLYRDVRLISLEEKTERIELEKKLEEERAKRVASEKHQSLLEARILELESTTEKETLKLESTKDEEMARVGENMNIKDGNEESMRYAKLKLEATKANLRVEQLETALAESRKQVPIGQDSIVRVQSRSGEISQLVLDRISLLETQAERIFLSSEQIPNRIVEKLSLQPFAWIKSLRDEMAQIRKEVSRSKKQENSYFDEKVERAVSERVGQLCERMKRVLKRQYNLDKKMKPLYRNDKEQVSALIARLEHAEQLAVLENKARECLQREAEALRKLLHDQVVNTTNPFDIYV